MINRQMSRQYLKFIEQHGYESTKDQMGYYYTKGFNKFSIVVTGNIYHCYHNKNIEGQWQLANKSNPFFEFSQSLMWVCTEIQKIQ